MSPAITATERRYNLHSAVLTPRLQKQLDAQLQEGEEILWQGQPAQSTGNAFTGNSLGCLVFVFVFAAPIVILTILEGVTHFKPTDGFHEIATYKADFTLLVILAAAAMWFKRSVRNMTAQSVYAVTSKRVLIIDAGKTKPEGVASITPDQLAYRAYQWDAVTFGTLYFPDALEFRWKANGQEYGPFEGCCFFNLKDLRLVDILISDTFNVAPAEFIPRLNLSTGEFHRLGGPRDSVRALRQSGSRQSG